MKTTAHFEIRSQKSIGSRNSKFGGPDTYVAVQVVPEGIDPLKQLNRNVAEKRGIEIIHFGEGYSEHSGIRSALGKAIAAAQEFVHNHNGKDN